MITAGTLHKQHLFDSGQKLDLLTDLILSTLEEYGWEKAGWAVFSNHYHLIARSPADPELRRLVGKIHGKSAIELNKVDGTPGRTVWFRSWPTLLTFQKSYLSRLAYVHFNAVKHGLVEDPRLYKWCSAAWFEPDADPAFYRTVTSMKYDRVNVHDDF
jgi:putative transposase